MHLFVYLPHIRPSLLLNDYECRERWSSRSTGPLTEDSCLPILQPGSEVSWDSACSQVRAPEERHHLVPVTERQGGASAFSPPFSQGNAGQANPAVPGRLTGWHGRELPIMPWWWRARWPWHTASSSPLTASQTACKRMDGVAQQYKRPFCVSYLIQCLYFITQKY